MTRTQAPQATCYEDNGRPLDFAEISDRLDEYGICEEDADRRDRAQVSDPTEWVFAEETCNYMDTFVGGITEDGPKLGGGRHQWTCKQAVRLACGWRLGCLTESDYHRAGELLGRRLTELRAATGERVGHLEVANALRFGVEIAATKTDDEIRHELGDHPHGTDSTAGTSTDDEPIPLTGNVVEVPPFPVDALPPVFARKVVELAEATQTDPAMAGTSALSVLAACIGGHACIEVRSGWREPLCLYTATIASPGERKSAVQASMVGPLHAAETEIGMAGELERLAQQDALELAKKMVDALNREAVNAAAKAAAPNASDKDKKDAEQAAQAAREAKKAMRGIEVPPIPRLLADDITPEATASLLADQGGRIAIISAEGGIFDTIAGRYARTVNMDVFLKGHSGDPIRVDRQGRGSQHIPHPALTMGLMVQPRVIETIAANRDFAGRGLLARFLYAQPARRVGTRAVGAKPVDSMTEHDYITAVKGLAGAMAQWADDPAVLVLHPFAEIAVRRLEEAVEPTLAGDGELASHDNLIEWGSKFVGAVVRIAGLLHLAEHGEPGHTTPLDADTIRAASRIGDYFKATAINVFARMADPDIANAVYLLDRIGSLNADEVSARDVFTASSRPRFPTVAAMKPALQRLVEHGYLIPLEPKKTGGRPASPRYRVHSATAAANAAHAAKGWAW